MNDGIINVLAPQQCRLYGIGSTEELTSTAAAATRSVTSDDVSRRSAVHLLSDSTQHEIWVCVAIVNVQERSLATHLREVRSQAHLSSSSLYSGQYLSAYVITSQHTNTTFRPLPSSSSLRCSSVLRCTKQDTFSHRWTLAANMRSLSTHSNLPFKHNELYVHDSLTLNDEGQCTERNCARFIVIRWGDV